MALRVCGNRSGGLRLGARVGTAVPSAPRAFAAERRGKRADKCGRTSERRELRRRFDWQVDQDARSMGLHSRPGAHRSNFIFPFLLDSQILSTGARLRARRCRIVRLDPLRCAPPGNLSSGAIPRYLISRGWSINRARKSTMLVVSCLMPVFLLLVTRVGSPALAIALMTAIMFGHAAWGNITLPAEVFPKQVVGTISGFGGALGAVVGAVTQWYIGNIVETLSFAPIFAAFPVIYLLSFGLLHWLIAGLG